MIPEVNSFIATHGGGVIKIMVALIIYIIGDWIIQTKGGIPIYNGKIVNKEKSIILIIISGLILLFIIPSFLESIFTPLIILYTAYIPSLIILLSGIALLIFDKRMRWNYKSYGIFLIIMGILLFILQYKQVF